MYVKHLMGKFVVQIREDNTYTYLRGAIHYIQYCAKYPLPLCFPLMKIYKKIRCNQLVLQQRKTSSQYLNQKCIRYQACTLYTVHCTIHSVHRTLQWCAILHVCYVKHFNKKTFFRSLSRRIASAYTNTIVKFVCVIFYVQNSFSNCN